MIARAAETDDTALVRAQLDAVLPIFADGLRLDRDVLEQWADFDARIGLVKERPDVERAFDFSAPLNAGRPNPVTVRAASDLGGGHWPPGFRAENGESRGLAAVTYVLRVRRINHLLPCSIAHKRLITQPSLSECGP